MCAQMPQRVRRAHRSASSKCAEACPAADARCNHATALASSFFRPARAKYPRAHHTTQITRMHANLCVRVSARKTHVARRCMHVRATRPYSCCRAAMTAHSASISGVAFEVLLAYSCRIEVGRHDEGSIRVAFGRPREVVLCSISSRLKVRVAVSAAPILVDYAQLSFELEVGGSQWWWDARPDLLDRWPLAWHRHLQRECDVESPPVVRCGVPYRSLHWCLRLCYPSHQAAFKYISVI